MVENDLLLLGRTSTSISMTFHQFRKYPNNASYFRINDIGSFEELKKVGENWVIEHYAAKILPDRNLVHDLLHKCPDFAICIDEEEYLLIEQKALKKD